MACNTKDNIRERINGLENRIEEFREKGKNSRLLRITEGNKDIVSRLMNDYNTVAKKHTVSRNIYFI